MKYISLPLFSDPYYSYSITLEGESYILEFLYNERMGLYTFGLYTPEQQPIVVGEALVPTTPLLLDYAIEGLNGYFLLEAKGDWKAESYKKYPDQIHQYYNLYYVYELEE